MPEEEQKQETRFDALKSWGVAGYNIGWDLGQGLALFLPKGLLQPFSKIAPTAPTSRGRTNYNQKSWWKSLTTTDKLNYYSKSTIQNGLLFPASLFANYILSPFLGILLGGLALLPGCIGGLIFNQHIRNFEYHYSIDVVNQHSATAVWGALGMGAILTYTSMGGGFSLPGFTIPSLFGIPALAVSPFLANWLLPIGLAYSLMIILSVGKALDRVYDISSKFAWYTGEKQEWQYPLKGKVNLRLKNEVIKQQVHERFQSEIGEMAKMYEQKFDQLRQEFERDPTQKELNRYGVLTQYQLLQEQTKLIDEIAIAPNQTEKQSIIDQRKDYFAKLVKRIK